MKVTGVKDVSNWPYPRALNDTSSDWLKGRPVGPSLSLMLSIGQIIGQLSGWLVGKSCLSRVCLPSVGAAKAQL